MTIFHLIDERVPIPIITPLAAGVSSSLLTLCYVGGLYVSTRTRIGAARGKDGALLTKDDAVVVKSRLKTVSATTLTSLLATGVYIRRAAFSNQPSPISTLSTLRVLGIPLPVPSLLHSNVLPFQPSLTLYSLHHVMPSIILPTVVTSTLFLGPLYVAALDGTLPFQRHFDLQSSVLSKVNNIWGIRNFVIGPLTEEVIFRGCILALHTLAGFNKKHLVFLTPLYFGIAHLHHAYESYVKDGRTKDALKKSLLVSGVQFAYTCVFGWYANFLFLRTGSVLSPFVAHVFCNIMGLPNPVEAARQYPKRRWRECLTVQRSSLTSH
jgi:prenyl protein peptidase